MEENMKELLKIEKWMEMENLPGKMGKHILGVM